MHIAVSLGDKSGRGFIEYVEWLAVNNHIPANAKGWVDHIRKKGNEANHEIILMRREDAKDLLEFSEMLLKVTYEFPSRINAKQKTP